MSFPRSPYTGFPFDAEATEQFPFNRQRPRGANLQSTLDDIAQRHPKIAKHLTNFNTPRTDRTGFPFDDDDIDFERYARQFYEHPEDLSQSSKHETQPDTSSNLQQSDSFDSSRKREGIDERSPRSSSAPPGGDIDSELGAGTVKEPPENMAQQEHRDGKPVERIIPILLEGRDEPIVPKNTGIPRQEHSQAQQGSNRRGFDEDQVDGPSVSNEHFSRHNCPGAQIPVQKDVPVSAVHKDKQPPHEHEPCKPEPPKPAPLSPIEQIQAIKQDVSKLLEDVEKFDGKTKDKQYLYLDEMLTRNLLKLDDIDTQGQENIRASRKEAIKCIQEAISLLENKVKCGNAGAPSESQCMEVDEVAEKVDCAANEAISETRAVLVSDNAESCDANKETRAVLVDGPGNDAECAAKDSEGTAPADENVQETDAKKEKKDKKGK